VSESGRAGPENGHIGQRIHYSEDLSGVVVGVVGTIRDFEELTPTCGTLYQRASPWYFYVMEVIVKTEGEPMRRADAWRAARTVPRNALRYE
jgi:hypothetical protein